MISRLEKKREGVYYDEITDNHIYSNWSNYWILNGWYNDRCRGGSSCFYSLQAREAFRQLIPQEIKLRRGRV